MNDKNKSKVVKTTPLTFEERMEKSMQDQAAQIASLTSMLQMQFDMIKNLQCGSVTACSQCGFIAKKTESYVMPQQEPANQEPEIKQNNFMIDNIIKIQNESKYQLVILTHAQRTLK